MSRFPSFFHVERLFGEPEHFDDDISTGNMNDDGRDPFFQCSASGSNRIFIEVSEPGSSAFRKRT